MEKNRKRRNEFPIDQEAFHGNEGNYGGQSSNWAGLRGSKRGGQRGFQKNNRRGTGRGFKSISDTGHRGKHYSGYRENHVFGGYLQLPDASQGLDQSTIGLEESSLTTGDIEQEMSDLSPAEQIRHMRKKQRMLVRQIEQEERMIHMMNEDLCDPPQQYYQGGANFMYRDESPMEYGYFEHPEGYGAERGQYGSQLGGYGYHSQEDSYTYDGFGNYQGGANHGFGERGGRGRRTDLGKSRGRGIDRFGGPNSHGEKSRGRGNRGGLHTGGWDRLDDYGFHSQSAFQDQPGNLPIGLGVPNSAAFQSSSGIVSSLSDSSGRTSLNSVKKKPQPKPHVAITDASSDYTGRLVKPSGTFDEKMARLNATIPLQSMVGEMKLQQQKRLETIEHFRTLVGNDKKIKAMCFFLRHTDPSDTSVRIIECQLYINSIFIASAKTRIARCSMEDLNEPTWSRCEERRDVLNDTYLQAWHTLLNTPVHDICNNHRMLKEGEVPEGTFSHVSHGSGKFTSTNISALVRMKHPYKPWLKNQLSDLVLMNNEEETGNSSFRILTRSCNQSGLLMEVENELKQFMTMNETTCRLYIAKVIIATSVAGNRETARQQTADAALAKLKKTQSFIQIFPYKVKTADKKWEEFVAEAEAWCKSREASSGTVDEYSTKPAESSNVSNKEDSSSTAKTLGQQQAGASDKWKHQGEDKVKTTQTTTTALKSAGQDMSMAYTTPAPQPTSSVPAACHGYQAANWPAYPNTETAPAFSSSTAGSAGSSAGYGHNYVGYSDLNWFGNNFTYDQYGYCYMLDSNGQYVPYDQHQAMLLNAQYSQYTGQFSGTGTGSYGIQSGQYASGGQWSSAGQFPHNPTNPTMDGTQTQKKGRWDNPIRQQPTGQQQLGQIIGENSNQIVSAVYANLRQPLGAYRPQKHSGGQSNSGSGTNKNKPFRGEMKSNRLLSSKPVCKCEGKFIHWREPLKPVNEKVVKYVEHIVSERSKEDSLSEVFICCQMPLAERQAVEGIALKYDFKLVVCSKNMKVCLVPWASTQEIVECLKRKNNRCGRIALLRIDGEPTGVNIDD